MNEELKARAEHEIHVARELGYQPASALIRDLIAEIERLSAESGLRHSAHESALDDLRDSEFRRERLKARITQLEQRAEQRRRRRNASDD